jgi:hypothetical protein
MSSFPISMSSMQRAFTEIGGGNSVETQDRDPAIGAEVLPARSRPPPVGADAMPLGQVLHLFRLYVPMQEAASLAVRTV